MSARDEVLAEAAEMLNRVGHPAAALVLRYADRTGEKASTTAPTAAGPTDMTPLVIRWDRTVIHPDTDPTDDTIVCGLTADGRPVALPLDEEHREALGLMLINPDGESGIESRTEMPIEHLNHIEYRLNSEDRTGTEVTDYATELLAEVRRLRTLTKNGHING